MLKNRQDEDDQNDKDVCVNDVALKDYNFSV